MNKLPPGFRYYLVKTKWGELCVVYSSITRYKDVNYYQPVRLDHDLKDEDISEVIGIDEEIFNKKEI